jgi:hypothetical protein
MKKNPITQPAKGSRKPIRSRCYRDRFQIDLIDFHKLRKRDPFGDLMRWVMTIKDHSTGLTYLCALPRKHPHLIAYKLQEIIGIIGYPKIFYTDNGKEFTAKVVIKALREMIPHIYAVTGRPRCPSDQVSVESMNMLVKRILGTLLTEHFHGRKTYKIKDRQKVMLQATRVIHACKKESLFFFANKLDNVLVRITLVV